MQRTTFYVLYYNSESQGDDSIISVHKTLEGAREKIIKLENEKANYDPDDPEYDEFIEPSPTKGVNMRGWGMSFYNVYPVTLED